jgi:hypothetical protein
MLAVIEAGSTTQLAMSARVKPKPSPWPFVLPTRRVRLSLGIFLPASILTRGLLDANLFKDAFLQAQKDNAPFFKKDDAAEETPVVTEAATEEKKEEAAPAEA